ncbi:uncharacterized protein [Onthophagus taurus]|uniref:uncharacterized protein n=1 Tax=Onthophagus taurus TaxID=166361 RepID=UPI000C20D91C|nr:uncharacterized protein LOC111425050 [Onthophagus taurus]
MIKSIAFMVILGVTLAVPANDNVLDKATANDVYANSVHPNDFPKVENEEKRETQTVVTETEKNPHPATAFGRLIDDIFNIPITVLQSVAKLLQNPFKSAKSPEDSTKY